MRREYSRSLMCSLVVLTAVFAARPVAADGAPPTITVRCDRGESLARTLDRKPDASDLTIVVKGVCQENVTIKRGGVTLLADPSGGAISAPDVTSDAVHVTGDDVTIDGLSVTGGRGGIVASGARRLTLRRCTVRNTQRTGVFFFQAAGGMVDGCTVQNAGRDGIALEGASATVINSTISQNTRAGVTVANGSSGRIGLDASSGGPAGNVIGPNGSTGLLISGASAVAAANTISGNGTDPAALFGRAGVTIVNGAQAQLPGGNTISTSAGAGIFVRGSALLMGNVNPDLGTVLNTVSGNGTASASQPGVELFLNSSGDLRNVVVDGNVGNGILVSTNSSMTLNNVTVTNSGRDGIQLVFGSSLFAAPPVSNVVNNAGFGLNCLDGESSVFGFVYTFGNGAGDVSDTCTGF